MGAANSMQVLEACQELDLDLPDNLPESLTLLELVYAISAIAQDDKVVVKTVVKMLASGRVQLRGNFRGDPIEDFEV
jgi:hypothetical protein